MSRFDNNCLWITCGVDYRLAVLRLVSVVRSNGEVGYPGVSDRVDADVPDIPTDFDSVQLFHNSSLDSLVFRLQMYI